MAFNLSNWWKTRSEETKKLILQGLFGIPYAAYSIFLFFNAISDQYSKEVPDYVAISLPTTETEEDDAFNRDARAKLKNFNHETIVAISNDTSQTMNDVVVTLPRSKGYWSATSNSGKRTMLAPFNGRVELPPIKPHDQVNLDIWHNDPIRPGELLTVSSKEYKTFREAFKPTSKTIDYSIPFWIATVIIGLFLGMTFYSWWRRPKPPLDTRTSSSDEKPPPSEETKA